MHSLAWLEEPSQTFWVLKTFETCYEKNNDIYNNMLHKPDQNLDNER